MIGCTGLLKQRYDYYWNKRPMTQQVEMISWEELVPADHPYCYFKQILSIIYPALPIGCVI